MKPVFSVIIPVFNAAETLAEALESVANQSFSDFEIVVVNDGSTDESVQILESFAKNHPALTVNLVEQANQGLGAARNAGVDQSRGEYCAFLDADDLWQPQKLESCYQYLKSSPACKALYHGVVAFTADGERKRNAYPVQGTRQLLQKGNPLVPSAVVLKHALIQRLRFTEDPLYLGAEDLHLWLRLLHQEVQLHFWPEYLTYYRAEGGMSTELEKHLLHVFAVLDHFYQKGYFKLSHLEMAKRRKYYEAGRLSQKQGQHFKAERYYAAADSKSMKILGLRFLNLLGFKV